MSNKKNTNNPIFDSLKNHLICSDEHINDPMVLKDLVLEHKDCSTKTKAEEYLNNKIMPVKVGNDKIGDNTLVINVNNPLNCISNKKGYCGACSFCYAQQNSTQYPTSCLYTLCQEINFKLMTVEEIKSSIDSYIKKNSKYTLEFVRWNEQGDFLDMECFYKVLEVSEYLYNKYGLISYAYTCNKELNISELNNNSIVVNFSYNTKTDSKHTVTVNKNQIRSYLDKEEYVICLGNCTSCSYCKDKEEKRTVVFTIHGYGKKVYKQLETVLSKNELKKLEIKKLRDYANFLERSL